MTHLRSSSRRAFLQFLAVSPAVVASGRVFGQDYADMYDPQAISAASEAVNVFDFQAAARRTLMPGHYTYLALGTDSGGTLLANREGFKKFQLRVRRLVDTREVDTSIELLGERYALPILMAPCGTQRAFHPQGEVAVARAAKAKGVAQILSTLSSIGVEEVNAAHGRPAWFQLYTSPDWSVTLERVKRAEAAGCPALVLTVDIPDTNREALARLRRETNLECQACHAPDAGVVKAPPMIDATGLGLNFLDWNYVDRLRDATPMKLLLKGIVTAEDAQLALEHGVDGVIVSNHGGRSEDSGRSTIESLPEVVAAIGGRIPVIVDGGFRRGTDIFKALALGADAIAIGRPYLWGLGSFGQDGVETVLDILARELQIVMRQAGTSRIEAITRRHVT